MAQIRPFSSNETDGLYQAMMTRLAASRMCLNSQVTQETSVRLRQELADYKADYRRDNPHLLGLGSHSQFQVPMKEQAIKPKPKRKVNIDMLNMSHSEQAKTAKQWKRAS